MTGRRRVPGGLVLLAAWLSQLALGALVLVSGLVMPAWAVVALALVWAAGAAALYRWRGSPWRTLAVPAAILLVWIAAVSAGEAWLGWTA